jgi:hypothetical protein
LLRIRKRESRPTDELQRFATEGGSFDAPRKANETRVYAIRGAALAMAGIAALVIGVENLNAQSSAGPNADSCASAAGAAALAGRGGDPISPPGEYPIKIYTVARGLVRHKKWPDGVSTIPRSSG